MYRWFHLTSNGNAYVRNHEKTEDCFGIIQRQMSFFSSRVVMLVLFIGKKLFMPKNHAKTKCFFSFVCNYAFFIEVQMKSPLIEKEICILLLQPIGSFWRTDFEKKWQLPSCKKQQKQIVNSIQKALFFHSIWLTWYWKPMIPPPAPKKPTNQLIHNYKTCIWDRYRRLLLTFFKGHSLLSSSLQKTINCCWMNVSLSQTPTFIPNLIDQLLL